MIRGFSIAFLLLVLIGCEDTSTPIMGNSFVREFLLKINHLGGENLSSEDHSFIEVAQKAKGLGEEVNEWLNSHKPQETQLWEGRKCEIERQWQGLLFSKALENHPKRNLLDLALLAYLSHLKGLEILFFPEDKDRKIYELYQYAKAFVVLHDTLLQSQNKTDILEAVRELRRSLNTVMIDVRYWPSRLSLDRQEYRQWWTLFKKGNLEGYYKQYFDRIGMLKDRIFNVRVWVDEQGHVYRPESIKNDFNQDYDLAWQTDLEMADLQIKHFLWIRNELEVMKENLIQDQASLEEEIEQTYEPSMLVLIIDCLILKYGKLLLSDLKWAILEEMKANGSEKLRKNIQKEEAPGLLSYEHHARFMSYVSLYQKEVEQKKDFMRENIFLNVAFSLDRLVKTVVQYEETVGDHRRSALFVLEDRPQWQSLWQAVQ